MSRDTVLAETDIRRCDLCGGEVEAVDADEADNLVNQDFDSALKDTIPDATILNGIGLLRFRWPSPSLRKAKADEVEAAITDDPEITSAYDAKATAMRREMRDRYALRDYDLHAECVANLIDSAVALRVKREDKIKAEAEREAAKDARLLARAKKMGLRA